MNKTIGAFLGFVMASSQMSSAAVIGGDVTSGDGIFQKLTPSSDAPLVVGRNNQDSDNLFAFDEMQNYKIVSDVLVDIGGIDGVIAAGTKVSSHYVFYDPVRARQQGYVDFSKPIIGVITSLGNLLETDPLGAPSWGDVTRSALGLQEVSYLSPGLRGLERGDVVEIDGDNENRLNVDWFAGRPGDYVRVITEADEEHVSPVPLPASGLLLIGALGLMVARRRR